MQKQKNDQAGWSACQMVRRANILTVLDSCYKIWHLKFNEPVE
ncbi:MAG: hypothetical protein VX737_04275 [Pseudomonadota bacterium]|nr:hypothetical protein [Pseudomonadota bacterium]